MDYMTTRQAADLIKMKPGELTAYVKKYPHLCPDRVGRMYLWTDTAVRGVEVFKQHRGAGECLHCGKPWDRPEAGPAEDATDGTE